MSPTEVVIFAERNGSAPLLRWLDGLKAKARAKCIVRIERLAEMGHELHRPEADYLRDGIHELRAKHEGVNYRVLYFFCGGGAVLSHGTTKEDTVPDREIEIALRGKALFEGDPDAHTYRE